VFAAGGPGALSEALASAVRAAGGEIRCGTAVAAITTRDGVATGVVLEGGEEIAATAVVSGVDPKRTLVDLADPVAIGPTMRWRAGNYRTPGVVAKVNLVVDRLPRFTAAGGADEQLLRGRILAAPGIDPIERAFDAAKYGRASETPVLEATIPSLVDPSLVDGAPDGTHVISVSAQYAPHRLRDGAWDEDGRADAFADRVVAVLDELAPGLASSIQAREVLTPQDLEREYGLSGGHPLHGEQALDQFFLWRPFLGSGRYRLPIDGLYLCASGAHPGGGITGQPGQNAAREILSDLKRRR
jgi:phytoene dehydrogenase-like protein